jgi:RND family efflux transporter MFP subunit
MKKIIIAIAVVIVLAAAAFVMLLRPVAEVATVTSDQAVNTVPGSVDVRAEYQMDLRSEIGGRLLTSKLDPGDPVKEGAKLAQLDTSDLKLDIERIENDYEAFKEQKAIGSSLVLDLDTATENLANYERLAKDGRYPLADLEKQRRAVKQIQQRVALEKVGNQQTVANYENTLAVKHRQLAKMTLTAPFDGVISQVYAHPGDLISGGAPIATLIATNRIVEAKISEENFADIKLGQSATVRFLGYGEKLYQAKVTKILPTADPDTQRYVVYLDVKIDREKLVPGITGEVSIVVGERHADAIIPRRALLGNDVFVVADGRAELRRVEVGYTSLTAAEILKGLKAGEQVIVERTDTFRDGDRVRAVSAEGKK